MTAIHIEAQVSPEQLLRAVEQLPPRELAMFVAQVLALRAKRDAPHLSHKEAALLMRINQGIPADLQRSYDDLITKRRATTLTPEDHAELLQLTDRIETLEADRIATLADLARLRHTSLTDLMHTLGIQPPAYV
jgi:hypothetical protein